MSGTRKSSAVESCPQPETPIRERVWTAEQVERAAEQLCVRSRDDLDAERMLRAYAATLRQQAESDHEFKNFHRQLSERFGYLHDEVDWKRDQVSLIEWIAKKVERCGVVVSEEMVERACLAYIAADLHLLAGAVDLMREPMRAALEAVAPLLRAPAERTGICFGSADDLATWLESLHETNDDGAITGGKWEPAQVAACAIRSVDKHRESVQLPPDWRREGMVVVVDSVTGKLLGCMGRTAWDAQANAEQCGRVDEAMVERAAAGLYAHLRPDAQVAWGDLNDYEADNIRDEATAAIEAALAQNAQGDAIGEVVEQDAARHGYTRAIKHYGKQPLPPGTKLYLHAEPQNAQGEAVAFFASDPANGDFEICNTLAEAIAEAERMLDFAKDDAAEGGWPDDPPQICYGVVLGECIEVAGSRQPAPEGSDFGEIVDFQLSNSANADRIFHAERARVPTGWRETILAVIDALDKATGDSDPNIDPDMTDEEVRDEYPEMWSMQQLTAMLAAPSQPAEGE